MRDRTFWAETIERAIRTFAQATLAVLGAEAVADGGVGVLDIDWVATFSVGLLAAVLAILTSLAFGNGTPVGTRATTNGHTGGQPPTTPPPPAAPPT